MNLKTKNLYPKIPLFTVLLLFTITFFVYSDFGIRMIFGYAVLVFAAIIYVIFRNNNVRFTRMKALYIILSAVLAILSMEGKKGSSTTVFMLAVALCALIAVIGDIRQKEVAWSYWILAVFSILISVYVVAVRIYPRFYRTVTRPLISLESRKVNDELIARGYGVSLGGNVVFIDYVLTLCALLTFNIIMAYKEKLRHKWLYWICFGICMVGMLFVNRKSEMLSFLVGMFFCYMMHMGMNTQGEKNKVTRITAIIVVVVAAGLIGLGAAGFLNRYVLFFQRIIYNMGDTETKIDVTSARNVLWVLALSIFTEHPFLGIGWGCFHDHLPEELSHLDNVHNNYIQLLCETGIIGFLLVMIPLILMLKETVRSIKVNRRKTNRAPMLMAANVTAYGLQISFLVLSFLDPCIYKMSFWPFFAIAVMLADCTEGAMSDTL